MRKDTAANYRWLVSALIVLLLAYSATAQVPASDSVVPRLVNYAGVAKDADGKPFKGMIGATFAVYAEQEGGSPLWMETQNINVSANGSFAVMLGATKPAGLPQDVFSSGQARWLGIRYNGGAEQPRVALLSVPYALKAGDAQTLGGLPPSAFALATAPPPPVTAIGTDSLATTAANIPPPASSDVTTNGGTVSTIPLFTTASSIQNSILVQAGITAVDVHGKLILPATGVATATAGKVSRPLDFVGSSFNSATSAAVNQTFQWQAEPAANNTANPSGTLNLLYGLGAATPTETGLKLSNKGVFTFAAGQTYPGAVTSVIAGTDLTGGGSGGNITLNLNTAATDARYAQLGGSNSFTGNETVSGNVTAGGNVSGDLGSFTGNSSNSILNVTQNATSGPGFAVVGSSSNTKQFQAAVLGQELAPYGTAEVLGVEGFIFGPSGAGVYGQNNGRSLLGSATSGGAGVWGDTAAPSTSGVLATADDNNGIVALNNSKVSAGILAENQNTSLGVVAPAIVGFSFAPNGMAVVGSGPVHSKTFNNTVSDIFQAYGVVGDSVAGIGVAGVSDTGNAVYGRSDGVGTGVWGSSTTGYGVYGESAGAGGVVGQNNGNGASVAIAAYGNSGTALLATSGDDTVEISSTGVNPQPLWAGQAGTDTGCFVGYGANGGLMCSGSKSAMVPLSDNRWVRLYAVESPENWFEDFGSGELSQGSAVVALDPVFADTVASTADYHVFLTPNGESRGLYVASKTATSFEVREQGGGTTSIAFDYRIVAHRKGYENIRLEDVTEVHSKHSAHLQALMKQPIPKPSRRTSADGAVPPQMQMPILPNRGLPLRANNLPVIPFVPTATTSTKH